MAKVIYSGVNNTARKVKNLYVGVNDIARKIKKAYVGVNNIARLCYSSNYIWARYSINTSYIMHISETIVNNNTIAPARGYYGHFTGSISGKYLTLTYVNVIQKSGTSADYSNVVTVGDYYSSPAAASSIVNSFDTYNEANTVNNTKYIFTPTQMLSRYFNGNCYRINDIVKNQSVGNFIDYVTSTNPLAYPDNGISGSYWYVRQ